MRGRTRSRRWCCCYPPSHHHHLVLLQSDTASKKGRRRRRLPVNTILPPEKGSATTTTTTTTGRRRSVARRNRSHVSLRESNVVSFCVQFPFLFFTSFFPTLSFFFRGEMFRVLVCMFFFFWKSPVGCFFEAKGGTSLSRILRVPPLVRACVCLSLVFL